MPGAPLTRTELSDTATVAAGLLDALPDATAILDPAGVIIGVNHAWTMFGRDNGGDPADTGVGVNYLDVCRRAAAKGCADAAAVASGLRAVLDGETVEREFEYPCSSPMVERWFVLRITPMVHPEPAAMVAHVNITRRKVAEQDLTMRASHDSLTGLANRELLAERLGAALTPRPPRSGRADVALLSLDLDGFKSVNDTYGHAAGDEVLQIVARQLGEATRPQDTVARLGGDEFAVLAPRMTPESTAALAARINAVLVEPLTVHGDRVAVGVSVGTYLASAGESVARCLERADQSMYAVKRAGGAGRPGAFRSGGSEE